MNPQLQTMIAAATTALANLDARLARLEMHFGPAIDTDPAIGHPELPLAEQADDEDEAEIRWAATEPSDNEIPSIPVKVGGNYYTRSGNAARVTCTGSDNYKGEVRVKGSWLSYQWHPDGRSYTGVSRLDIVATTPF
jgi:hypothetical protein